jgi:dipeptidyl aminopeptidase/acylaminoacyl peptidase
VVAALREPAFAAQHRVDAERIVLVGHSMGGALALLSAARLPEVGCAASLAGANLGTFGALVNADAETRRSLAATFQTWGEGRVANVSGEAMVSDLIAHRDAYAAANHAAALARKPVLLVAGADDTVTPPATHHTPLLHAIRAQGGELLRAAVLGGDHSFSDSRIALARTVLGWLRDDCAPRLARD